MHTFTPHGDSVSLTTPCKRLSLTSDATRVESVPVKRQRDPLPVSGYSIAVVVLAIILVVAGSELAIAVAIGSTAKAVGDLINGVSRG